MIANARMYAIGGAAAAWRTLLEWVVARAGVACDVIDYPPPQPLAALWARPDLGCAFMCGYPFSTTVPRPTLLAAPVPNPAPHGGRPVYWTDIVVAAESRLERLEDTFGATFAWTSEDSYSGWHAPRLLLAPHAQRRGGPLFAATIGPLVTPRAVAVAVAEGRADAGPLDCYAHALLRTHEPALAARLRVDRADAGGADSAAGRRTRDGTGRCKRASARCSWTPTGSPDSPPRVRRCRSTASPPSRPSCTTGSPRTRVAPMPWAIPASRRPWEARIDRPLLHVKNRPFRPRHTPLRRTR